MLFALVAHAGINVLNDFLRRPQRRRRGQRRAGFPFTGGSRFIQNGVLSEAETGAPGLGLLLPGGAGGLWLAAVGPG